MCTLNRSCLLLIDFTCFVNSCSFGSSIISLNIQVDDFTVTLIRTLFSSLSTFCAMFAVQILILSSKFLAISMPTISIIKPKQTIQLVVCSESAKICLLCGTDKFVKLKLRCPRDLRFFFFFYEIVSHYHCKIWQSDITSIKIFHFILKIRRYHKRIAFFTPFAVVKLTRAV